MPRIILMCIVVLAVLGIGWALNQPPSANQAERWSDEQPQAAPEPTRGLIRAEQDVEEPRYGPSHVRAIYVGHTYHVGEGFTDEDWAKALLGARAAGNADGIRTAYGMDSYRQFRPSVACTATDQPQRGTLDPIACKLKDGSTIYATDIDLNQ